MRLFLSSILMIVFLVTGCATVKPIPVEKLDAIKKIGVISIVEDKLIMQFVGLTVFNNFTEEIPVKDWKIDRFVIDEFKKQFKKTKIEFITFDYEYEPLLKVYKSGFGLKDISEELAKIAKNNSLDAIILVKRETFQDPVNHDDYVSGYGVFQRSKIIFKSSAMFLVATAYIYDARSMESLGSFGLIDNKEVDNSYFAKDFSTLPQEKKELIESWIKESIKERIEKGLGSLGIIQHDSRI